MKGCGVMEFKLSELEEERWKEFDKYHQKECQVTLETTFKNTGIAPLVKVRCTKCGEERDITDYYLW